MSDEAARRRITDDLETTFLVEAGAGSGKTRSLVDRMIAMIAKGRATIQTLAAVTFTRKAAAELRGRFQVELERSLATGVGADGKAWRPSEKERLATALRDLEQGFIGTIHSFCARLLRERPVECGVDPEFTEMEEIDDAVFRETCWHDHLARVLQGPGDVFRGLDEAGLAPADLRDAFDVLAMYPDVEPVPGRKEPPDLGAARAALESFLERAEAALPAERPGSGWDGLQFLTRRLCGRRDRLGFTDTGLLMESFELLEGKPKLVQKCWPAKEDGKAFEEAFRDFQARVAGPVLRAWREFRHDRALAFLLPALEYYDGRRAARSRLNFGDQLLRAAALLRDNPEVRRYFQGRFESVLVDEFQDTDPIQAEILFYLAGEDAGETDWTRLRPAPGSLFLVGDPKQSIYRFRRADIDTYNLVKRIIVQGGGEVLGLTANFRSLPCIGEFVDGAFGRSGDADPVFPDEPTDFQARFAPLMTRRTGCDGAAGGIFKIVDPREVRHSEKPICRNDAAAVSEFIDRACSGGLLISERAGDGKERARPARPEDFLVLFRYKKNMDIYARSLEEKGIPYEITGSDGFSESEDVAEVVALMQALKDPADAVHAVAALRGVFFGLSDQALHDHRAAGGSLTPRAEGRPSDGPAPGPVGRAMARLGEWREWTRTCPPSVVLERVLEDSGLLGYLVSTEMGGSRAGNVLKLVEIVRSLETEGQTSFAGVVDFLAAPGRLEAVEEMSLTPGRRGAVRLMNLHKAKGLEAPVVFLANPAGLRDRDPDKHIVRLEGGSAPGSGPVPGKPRGYFQFKKRVGRQSKLLSQPAGWDGVVERAKLYRDAEEHRLMYVAATRAKDTLVVSSYDGDLGAKKAWRLLDGRLEGVENLPLLSAGPRAPAPPPAAAVTASEVAAAERRMRDKKSAALRARYRLETATSLAKSGARPEDWGAGGRGREWGTAVHSLLNALGRAWSRGAPGPAGLPVGAGELEGMAGNALAAVGLGRGQAGELAALGASIARTEFWARAMAAGRKHFEVPFSVRVEAGDPDHAALLSGGPLFARAGGKPVDVVPGAPVFLSGAIDLVFREADGWVVADYKSDRITEEGLGRGAAAAKQAFDALVAYYAPQVRIYTRLWERLTGERVKEAGLYFTSFEAWVPVDGR